ncbi:dTDP-3-amino-3,6-dideoxy-alpha-D-glucopyranose N,N-dimethyltransferase/dTDP-3-amino-3,4,6-trideoxy-alpha-D-glucopyranose N,N-dimethyltransferase [Prauserella shujinwangii]|uniref:dTDP-3-amino-3,6-dideoxy-alpha-D-glucopyranose N,N-dimethyltransferase/dTDP-3-amino-3,4, 6-trideoxy-alpha-D-glucopyranose N,N-dimethyltransferase n=1 Tax=Prauserella shujinwangii TaxID=1453103 RepID=A0A2T0M420_9PSEU|nr:class I SAM-dependent methyltransferase [Prauserella shujinwangii]PRX51449.1 dTDP-3-amino-3,6-dideoxy-alpha-D-glucopyranose N,N-dimethyltransferase/dTDP-3-amino-3,4,6-trideoxy-alpha-D-glucopyranose N,N-dimethyltransferase [Prauserella shujinwangii]
MYQDEYIEVYDLVMRNRGRDYAGEARAILGLVDERNPGAASLLDVACGTGLHLRELAAPFAEVHGLDVSEDMLALAKRRIEGLRCHQADMRRVRLPVRFDVIVCMFAIPHLRSGPELDATVAGLAAQLAPGGLLIIEPWYRPEQFVPGYVARDVVEVDGHTVVRLSHSRWLDRRANRIRMVVHHALADADHGIRHATDEVDLTLFTDEQYRHAFAAAGCTAERFTGAPFTWGLWLAQRRETR